MNVMLLALTPLFFVQGQEPELAVYSDRDINLAFSYPKTWRQVSKDRRRTVLEIPSETPGQNGRLELIRVQFRGEAEGWQELQKTTFDLQKRTITRQWQQEIMGAPLLLTQTEFTEVGVGTTQVSGLFYTRSNEKLLFHLKAPASLFEKVWFTWQRTMESFRTIDGSTLAKEDPSQPPVPPKKPDTRPVRRVLDDGKPGPLPRGMRRLGTLTFGSTVLALDGINDWKFVPGEKPETGTFMFRNKPVLRVEAKFLGDSTEAARLLAERSGARLAKFSKISLREDIDTLTTPQETTLASVLRQGVGVESPDLLTFDAYVKAGTHYIVLEAESTNRKEWKDFGKLVRQFLTSMRMQALP